MWVDLHINSTGALTTTTTESGKTIRRQRLDEEYQPLLITDGDVQTPLCFFGPSLITVIFGAQTIVDATLFFISGGHKRYKFTPTEESEAQGVIDVRFTDPRIPSFFSHLLPSVDTVIAKHTRRSRARAASEDKKTSTQQRTRKKCAFFNVMVLRKGRTAIEPQVVHLSADVKLFHYTVHVCGLRDIRDADIVMRYIHQAFVDNQLLLDSHDPDILNELASGDEERKAFLESNNRCCTVPLVLSEGDVVMTNSCGRFPTPLNLRGTYEIFTTRYPAVLTYLTTMSKSNYLAVTLFEHYPFIPVLAIEEMSEGRREEIVRARHSYLMSGKKGRSKLRKHTFFIYASGRFIQSSRNNAAALRYTEICMFLLRTVTSGLEVPKLLVLHDEEETATVTEEGDGPSEDDEE